MYVTIHLNTDNLLAFLFFQLKFKKNEVLFSRYTYLSKKKLKNLLVLGRRTVVHREDCESRNKLIQYIIKGHFFLQNSNISNFRKSFDSDFFV